MAQNGVISKTLDSLSLSDTELDDTEDLFASPSVPSKKSTPGERTEAVQAQSPARHADSEEDTLAAHEASLRRELLSLRTMNQVVSGVVESLDRARSNMNSVSATVNSASTLLTTWTRILSQTEHNQRLILNPSWQGASQDIADEENEEILKQQEKERSREEEIRREEARETERGEDERRRMTEGTTKAPRGRGRGAGRGMRRGSSSAYVGTGGHRDLRGTARVGTMTPRRAPAGTGRGIISARSRGRGVD